jgi:hypothetical protein
MCNEVLGDDTEDIIKEHYYEQYVNPVAGEFSDEFKDKERDIFE